MRGPPARHEAPEKGGPGGGKRKACGGGLRLVMGLSTGFVGAQGTAAHVPPRGWLPVSLGQS